MGQIISVADNVITVRGLYNVKIGEVVSILYTTKINKKKIVGEIIGQALNLNNDGTTNIVVFGDETLILAGNYVFGSGYLLSIKTGTSILGSIVNALGNIILKGANKNNIITEPSQYQINKDYNDHKIANYLKLQ
jgi:F0F1-type ATP synthase alpha subunit